MSAGKFEIREATGHTISKPRQRINPGVEDASAYPHDRTYIGYRQFESSTGNRLGLEPEGRAPDLDKGGMIA